MSLGILSTLIKPPHLTAPTVSATPLSFTSKGVFQGLWSRVVDMYTSLLKSNDRIDNLQQMPVHEREVANAIIGWRRKASGVDKAIVSNVDTLRQSISEIVTTTATPFATAMTRLNAAYKQITNHTVDELTLERRKLLSQSQKARLVQVHDQMKDELENTKTNYNTATTAINEAGQSLTDLLALDKRQRDELRVYDPGRGFARGIYATFGDIDLLDPLKQAVCRDFDQRLELFYNNARRSAFATLAASTGVVTRNLQGIKDAMATATQALQVARRTVASVVETVSATARHYTSNDAVRTNILSGVAPTDPALRIVHVSARTLDALQEWFADKTVAQETALTVGLARATTQTEFEAWNTNAQTFGTASERYRLTLQHVGNALYPFTPLIDELARRGNPEPLNTYVNEVKARIEATAVNLVENFPHNESIKLLGDLAELSTRFTQATSRRLQGGGAMTPAEIATARLVVDAKLAEIENCGDVF